MTLHVLLVALMSLHGADLATTEYCLGAGHCTELNRLFAPLGTTPVAFGAAKLGVASAESWFLLTQQKRHPTLVLFIAGVSIGLYTGVVIHNAQQLQKAHSR